MQWLAQKAWVKPQNQVLSLEFSDFHLTVELSHLRVAGVPVMGGWRHTVHRSNPAITGFGFPFVWFGIVWYCIVWFCIVWYGIVWFGMVW